jgi:hypothetical protein
MSGWRRSRFINVSGSRPEFSMPVDGEVGILTLPAALLDIFILRANDQGGIRARLSSMITVRVF